MKLPDIHFYLRSYYFSYWAYVPPALCLLGGTLFLIFFITEQAERQLLHLPQLERYAWFMLLIYMSIVCLGFLIVWWYKIAQFKKTRFKTEPYITITSKGVFFHEDNTFLAWQDTKDIRHVRTKHSNYISIQLQNKAYITLERRFTISRENIAKHMLKYHTTAMGKQESPSFFANCKQKIKDAYKKFRS